MYSAEDLFTEGDVNNDLIQEDLNDGNSENEQRQENENDSGNEQQQENDDEEKKVVKPKRVVRNPQPKLNVETLKGPKGLLCLEGYFKNKKYKGRGHERDDLRTIMKTYEHWCHRLFPKLPFDDCLAKIESVGAKKPAQTYLKRIRMDLIFDEEKPVRNDDDDDDDEENRATHNQFDELTPQDFNVTTQTVVQDDDQQLTEEQLERIRLNKERADRLRREKLERRKEALAGTSQMEDYVVEEQIPTNKEQLCQETSKRNELHKSDFIAEETPEVLKNAMEIDLGCQSDDIEIGNSPSTFDVDAGDTVEEECVESEGRHENNDLIMQCTKSPESEKSEIIVEVAQSDKETEEPMD